MLPPKLVTWLKFGVLVVALVTADETCDYFRSGLPQSDATWIKFILSIIPGLIFLLGYRLLFVEQGKRMFSGRLIVFPVLLTAFLAVLTLGFLLKTWLAHDRTAGNIGSLLTAGHGWLIPGVMLTAFLVSLLLNSRKDIR